MAYLHGVYVSEAQTSITPGVNTASCLPYVIGTVPQNRYDVDTSDYTLNTPTVALLASGEKIEYKSGHTYVGLVSGVVSADVTITDSGGFVAIELSAAHDDVTVQETLDVTTAKPILCKTYKEFLKAFDVVDVNVEGEDPSTLMATARQWYKRAGGGDAFWVPVTVTGSAITPADMTDALTALDTVYEQFGVLPTVLLCPRYGAADAAAIAAKCANYGSGFGAVAILDIAYTWGSGSPSIPLNSTYLSYASPRCVYGAEIVPPSAAVLGAMTNTDAENGGFPYVSPSNKVAFIEGLVDEAGDPIFLDRPHANDDFNAHGVITFRHTAKGWVVWGNNTSAYPGSTDPKDRFLPIRRTFQYVKNDFLLFGESRIDNPINKRQLDGVLNSYNLRLQGFTGIGMVNSASVAMDPDLNTAASLLDGRVYIKTMISPPPPMENLSNTFEYDVNGFVESLS